MQPQKMTPEEIRDLREKIFDRALELTNKRRMKLEKKKLRKEILESQRAAKWGKPGVRPAKGGKARPGSVHIKDSTT